MSIADYVYLISAGKVVDHGSTEKMQTSGSAWTRQFIDGLADGPVPFHYRARPLFEDLFTAGAY